MSADGPGYTIDKEVADLGEAARFAGDGEPVLVIAYSYGALIALKAVVAGAAPIRALAAYEAPLGVPDMMPAVDEVLTLFEAGDADAANRLFVRTTFGLSEHTVEAMAAHPMWQVTLAAAPTLPRELRVVRDAQLDPPAAPASVPPVRYLVAEEGGNPAFHEVAAIVLDTIPGADVATVPGLPHFAIATEPEAFVARAREALAR
jgi:pimeloyl-ACP methyl ester carboxylesterase